MKSRWPCRLAAVALAVIAPALVLAAIVGCTPYAIVNAFVPSDDYTLSTAAYGANPRQQIDIYRPRDRRGAAPVVVFFYGGSWQSGARAENRFVGEALASRGIVAVIADYRVYPQVRYPDFVRDSASAVAWTLREIGGYGGDPARVFVMGHSAGAYNAAMVALDPRWLRAAGAPPIPLAGWIGLAGPYDFLPITGDDIKRVFDYPGTPRDSQPLAHADGHSPPALLIAATDDGLVDPQRNTMQMATKLRGAGVPVKTHMLDSVNHVTLIAVMAKPLRGIAPVLDYVAEFVTSTRAR
ncbi:MAG: alpha/beta hydrolase [Casimicrobiaceae bacterium]